MNKQLFYIIAVYFCFISLLSIILTVCDKLKAQKGKWRIPEKTLLICGALGGSAAEYITMKIIRHKTLHKKFMIGLPAIFILQVAAAVAIFIAI